MAESVLSAAGGSLLVLVALLLKCQCTCSGTISTNAAQVIPSSYTILSVAVYEDLACEPPSSSMRGTPNSPVTCFPRQATGATPRLTDDVLGPDSPTSPTTDYAYTLAGSSQFGLFETWITFDFTSRVSLASVTLHYYCTGQTPQLQFQGRSGVVAPPVSPPCYSTAQRQCFTFNVSTSTEQMNLKVLRNSNTIYISELEVKFIAESGTHTTDSTNMMEMSTATPSNHITSTLPNSSQTTTMATPKTSPSGLPSNNSSAVAATTIPNSNQPGPLSTDSITSIPVPNSSQTTPMATPKNTSNNNETSSAVAGAVAGVVAGLVVCIAVSVLLIIACLIFKRRRNISKDDGFIDKPVYHTTAEGKVSQEHSEETYTTLHNPLYETGKGPDDEPTDNHYTTVAGPHYDAVDKESRASPSTGQTTHPTSPAAYYEIEASADTYSVPFGPDTDVYTVPADATNSKPLAPKRLNSLERSANFATGNGKIDRSQSSDPDHTYSAVGQKATEPGRLPPGTSGNEGTFSQAVPVYSVSYARKGSQKVTPEDIDKEPTNPPTQKGRQAGDSVAMELEGLDSEKSDATAEAVYAVVDKKRKEGERAIAASEIREFELEKSAAIAGAVYAVLDKKKKAPPPLPPPYKPRD